MLTDLLRGDKHSNAEGPFQGPQSTFKPQPYHSQLTAASSLSCCAINMLLVFKESTLAFGL